MDRARRELRLAVRGHELAHEVGPYRELYGRRGVREVREREGQRSFPIKKADPNGESRLTLAREVEQEREFLSVGHLRTFLPELVEEGVAHRFHRAQPGLRRVLEQLRNEVDRLGSCARAEDLYGARAVP